MILTVTLNPLLERRFEYDSVSLGASHRNPIESIIAGGKGINVSRQLLNLKTLNSAITFAGGFSGKYYKKLLHDEGINCTFIQTISETRNGSVVIDKSDNSSSTFFGADSQISSTEADEFLNKLQKMISNCEIVILSGSSPGESTDHIFPEAIGIANQLDKISIVDTYGRHLQQCFEASPTIIHNNQEELKTLHNFSGENSIYQLLDSLYSKGIKQAFITDGPNPVFASSFDFHYKIKFPPIVQKDPTGSGDAFTAGIAFGWHNNLTFEETAIIASSLGSLNAAEFSICKANISEVQQFKSKVVVTPIGKKMKTIDVTPQ